MSTSKRGDLPSWGLRQNLRQQKVLGSDMGSPAKTHLQLPVVPEKPSRATWLPCGTGSLSVRCGNNAYSLNCGEV